jgi:hypothetical protein
VLYVYDCGSFDATSLTREINQFRDRDRACIDLLFISHFHFDHVSGLPELLAVKDVDTIILPSVSVIERLFVLAQALRTGVALTPWYRDFVSNPEGALRRISHSANIILAENEVEFETDDDGDDDGDDADDDDAVTYPDGPPQTPQGSGEADVSGSAVLASGQRSILYGGNVPGTPIINLWEWSTFTVKIARGRLEQFHVALQTILMITQEELDLILQDSNKVRSLVEGHAEEIEDAYILIYPDLNLSSMLLYSGPFAEHPYAGVSHRTRSVVERAEIAAWEIRPGWLGTGDQKMGVRRCAEVSRYFKQGLLRVGTVALPHHGAASSFSPKLLTLFGHGRPVCVVSVGIRNSYGHPATSVIRDASSNGNHVVVVTEGEESRWTESGIIFL